jgi:PAS domain S-box-containing protein
MSIAGRSSRAVLGDVQEQFRLVVDGVEDYAIFLLDVGGRVLSWNAGAQRIKGYAAEEIIGQHFSRFYPDEVARSGQLEAELETAAREGHYREEGWRVRKDGSLFWANVLINAVRDAKGTLTGFLKITRDLTERKRSEDALRQTEERFRLLVDSVQDYAIFMLDPGGHVVSWNAGAARIKGYQAQEIIGRHFSAFYPEEDARRDKPASELERAIAEGRYEEEGWRVRKDGAKFWANVVITPVRGPDGALRGFAKVTRDLTARRQAEEQRLTLVGEQVARAEAEKANRSKDEFLAILSHELRTPLNAIVGWTEMLRGGALGPEQEERALEILERNARIQTQIVSDVLDVSRVTSGKLRLNPRRIDLRSVVTAAVDTIRPSAEAKQIALDLELSDARWVWGDPDRLQQVAWNLLSNAVKFTPREGRVTVTLREDGPQSELVVADTGAGIRPEFLSHVFELFRQEDSSPSRTHGGLGLGLALARHLVELHGGQIEAQSEGVGRGAQFRLKLPVAVGERQGSAPARPADMAPRLDGIRVLLVEDHDDSRGFIRLSLDTLGATVMEACEAKEGFDLVVREHPDVLVMDIELPGKNGYELMAEIRALPLESGGLLPAIALTAYARTEDRLRALTAGFQVHLAKPIQPRELARAIAGLVGRPPGSGP